MRRTDWQNVADFCAGLLLMAFALLITFFVLGMLIVKLQPLGHWGAAIGGLLIAGLFLWEGVSLSKRTP